ncbi:MAG: hypothetical protein J6K87_02230 [Clostridia bacterium]|nr:hypothetical protein [Clostridia bacterium]
MKIVKSWKKNLKRTGALALATLVMCGGASFARAEDITLNQLGSDSTVEEKLNEETGNYETGNVKTVLGYQTDTSTGYAANITWGNMIFVYDNGKYDPETGKLVASGFSYVQPDVTNGTLGIEYVHEVREKEDGEKLVFRDASGNEYYEDGCYWEKQTAEGNVEILEEEVPEDIEEVSRNIPGDGTVTYTSGDTTYYKKYLFVSMDWDLNPETYNPQKEVAGITSVGAYRNKKETESAGFWYNFDGENNVVKIENLSTSDIKFAASTAVDTAVAGNHVSFSLYSADSSINLAEDTEKAYKPEHGDPETIWYVGSEASGSLKAPVLNEVTGEVTTPGKTVEFYLNISGKPNADITRQSDYEDETAASALGTITLNFTTENNETLTPVITESEEETE